MDTGDQEVLRKASGRCQWMQRPVGGSSSPGGRVWESAELWVWSRGPECGGQRRERMEQSQVLETPWGLVSREDWPRGLGGTGL